MLTINIKPIVVMVVVEAGSANQDSLTPPSFSLIKKNVRFSCEWGDRQRTCANPGISTLNCNNKIYCGEHLTAHKKWCDACKNLTAKNKYKISCISFILSKY